MMDDAGYILDKTIDESKKEIAKLRIKSRQIVNHKRIASSKKANKDKLVKTLEFAKRALINTLQHNQISRNQGQGQRGHY